MTEGDGTTPFLARWARLKEQAREEEKAGPARVDLDLPAEEPHGTLADPREIPEDLKDIDIETLDAEATDFSRFLEDDVPAHLRRMALRKLWESDPVLANLDGLNDYDEDFTPAGLSAAAADFFRRASDWLEKIEEAERNKPDAEETSPQADAPPPPGEEPQS